MNYTDGNKKCFRYLPTVALALLGAIGGYCYYYFVGCASGACAITSNPFISTVYGGIIGGLLGSVVTPNKCRAHKEEEANG